ncbi:MAG TPA: TetR family transcriptional regulator [bacterium]|jgi:TetR/AcrR family transcriptional regulator
MPTPKDHPHPDSEASAFASLREAANSVPPEDLRPPDPDSPRGRILSAARDLFAAHGFDGTSTRAVSEAAGVNLAMIHYYFGSKEQLYERVLAGAIIELRQGTVTALPEGVSPAEALITLPIRMMSTLRADPVRAALIRREIATGGTYAIKAIQALGEHGPLRLVEIFRSTYGNAAQHGLVRDLPPKAVHECLMSIAFSALLFGPVLSAVAGRDFTDDTAWEEWKETWSTLLRQGLLLEKP